MRTYNSAGVSLHSLGLSPLEEQVWRFFLREPGCDREEAVRELGIDAAAADGVVGRLVALQILVPTDEEDGFFAADPQHTLGILLGSRLTGVTSELHNIIAASEGLPGLLIEQRSGRSVEMVEHLEPRETAQQRIAQVGLGAKEVLAMRGPHHPINAKAHGANTPVAQRIREGAAFRTLIHRSLLDNAESARYHREYHAAGDHHRVTAADLRDAVIFDRATAFVRPGFDDEGKGALLIRQPGLVSVLVAFFEETWKTAVDLDSGPDHPTDTERRVLELLTEFGKDEVAARELGVSVRTFRRHVADLMTRLGATNRFHAGYLAAQRGWL